MTPRCPDLLSPRGVLNRLTKQLKCQICWPRPSWPIRSFILLTFRCLSASSNLSATVSLQRENKESRSPRSGAVDLPVVTDSIRNIKSMWEKGSVFSSPGSGGAQFKVKGEAVRWKSAYRLRGAR